MTEAEHNPHSDVAFLGLCERVSYDVRLAKYNIIGLGGHIFSHIFPTNLTPYFIALSIRNIEKLHTYKFEITNDCGMQVAWLTITPHEAEKYSETYVENFERVLISQSWTNVFLPLQDLNASLEHPGAYNLNLLTEDKKTKIGEFIAQYVEAPKLTDETKAAIKSDPTSAKAVRVVLGCRFCDSKSRAYAAIDPIKKQEKEGYLWYENLPDRFDCECGKTSTELKYIKNNLHAFLGHSLQDVEIEAIPYYEKTALQNLRNKFLNLLDSEPKEEIIQRFIADNPILLHQFTAQKIIPKPPIFSSYKADFGIVTSQKELLLVEIETTKTKLMKNNGHQHSELTHAFDQVKDWLHIIEEHRISVLSDLKIGKDEVNVIKGIVIAGREKGYDADKMRRLKMAEQGRITFLTYDDLLHALEALITRFSKIK